MTTFDNIFAAGYEKAVRFARADCHLQDDMAEEIVADAFINLHKALQNGVDIKNLDAWLCKTIRLRYAEHLRYEHRIKRGGKFAKHQLTGANLSVEHLEFNGVDAIDTLQSVWNCLTTMEKTISTMVFMQEFSHAQIAEQLGVTVRTIERRVNRVRKRFRALLSSP